MNKKLLPIVSLLVAALPCVHAQTAPAATSAPSVTVTATGSVVSNYMFRGQRLNTAAFQPVVEATAGDLTLGAWSTWPFKEKDVPDTSAPEIDIYGSYNFALSKEASVAPGFTLYWYPEAPTSAGFYKSTFEPNVALNYTFQGVKITPKVYYDMVLDGATYEATITYAVPMKDIGTELDFTAVGGTYKLKDAVKGSNPDTKAWGDYWLLGVAMPFQLTKESKLTLGFAYTEGRNAFLKAGSLPKSVNSLAVGRGVVTVSYSYAF
jgi:uncharacterized protein (TIGR02001 family)